MIPKVIHYCWFGDNTKPRLIKKCIRSWKRYCRDYTFIEWNETNFDISEAPLFVQQAYHAKKWSFVSDYVRLYVVYHWGGVYLDTDVELIKPISHLLNCDAYYGFETIDGKNYVSTGLGFGSISGHQILLDLMKDYDSLSFSSKDGQVYDTPCPMLNSHVFMEYGFIMNNERQTINDVALLPSSYFGPYYVSKKNAKPETVSIHHGTATWMSDKKRKKRSRIIKKIKREMMLDSIIHIPNYILKGMIGEEKYNRMKVLLRHESDAHN